MPEVTAAKAANELEALLPVLREIVNAIRTDCEPDPHAALYWAFEEMQEIIKPFSATLKPPSVRRLVNAALRYRDQIQT
jgi:hypothetical protein